MLWVCVRVSVCRPGMGCVGVVLVTAEFRVLGSKGTQLHMATQMVPQTQARAHTHKLNAHIQKCMFTHLGQAHIHTQTHTHSHM